MDVQPYWQGGSFGIWRWIAWVMIQENKCLQGLHLLSNSVAIKYGSTEQDWLWDDALLDSEKDVICGVYHVYTGKWSPI